MEKGKSRIDLQKIQITIQYPIALTSMSIIINLKSWDFQKSFPPIPVDPVIRKLISRKIKWIISVCETGEPISIIAQIQGVSDRRGRQIYQLYRKTGENPMLKPPGRPARTLLEEEVSLILETYGVAGATPYCSRISL